MQSIVMKDKYMIQLFLTYKKYLNRLRIQLSSDRNDPKRINNVGVKENNPTNVVNLTQAQNNIIKLIINLIIRYPHE